MKRVIVLGVLIVLGHLAQNARDMEMTQVQGFDAAFETGVGQPYEFVPKYLRRSAS